MPEEIDDDFDYHVSRLGDSSWLVEHRGARVAIVEQVETVPDSYISKGRYRKNGGEVCVLGYQITTLEGAPEHHFNSPQEAAEAAAFYHLNSSSDLRMNDFQKLIVGVNRVRDDILAAASCDNLYGTDQAFLLVVSHRVV